MGRDDVEPAGLAFSLRGASLPLALNYRSVELDRADFCLA
jgi:hypothetical protein